MLSPPPKLPPPAAVVDGPRHSGWWRSRRSTVLFETVSFCSKRVAASIADGPPPLVVAALPVDGCCRPPPRVPRLKEAAAGDGISTRDG